MKAEPVFSDEKILEKEVRRVPTTSILIPPVPPLNTKDSIILEGLEWWEDRETSDAGRKLANPPELDGSIPALTVGRATLLGGPPNIGKTALALQWWRTLLEEGETGPFITLEMTPSDLLERFEKQFETPADCKEWLEKYKPKVTRSYIIPEQIERIITSEQYSFAIIDHLHELPYRDRFQLEAEVKKILNMATEHDIALLALAQLKRPEQFQTEPRLHDWRESGVFEQKASVTLQLWKDPSDLHAEDVTLYNLKHRFEKKWEPVELCLDETAVIFRRA